MKVFIFPFLFLLLSSCQPDPYKELKKELKGFLKDGKTKDAIEAAEAAPYGSIRDTEVAFLIAQAYSRESLLEEDFVSEIFTEDPEERALSLTSISKRLSPYTFEKLLSLKHAVSAFYRSRHDEKGTPLDIFSKEQVENFLRESILRMGYLAGQLTEFIELCEMMPYFHSKGSIKSYLSVFSNSVDDIMSTYEDLEEQSKTISYPVLSSISTSLNEKKFSLSFRGKSYFFTWKNSFEESLYKLAEDLKGKMLSLENLTHDLNGISVISQDLASSHELRSYLPGTAIASKLKESDLENQKKILHEALGEFEKKLDMLEESPKGTLREKVSLLKKIIE